MSVAVFGVFGVMLECVRRVQCWCVWRNGLSSAGVLGEFSVGVFGEFGLLRCGVFGVSGSAPPSSLAQDHTQHISTGTAKSKAFPVQRERSRGAMHLILAAEHISTGTAKSKAFPVQRVRSRGAMHLIWRRQPPSTAVLRARSRWVRRRKPASRITRCSVPTNCAVAPYVLSTGDYYQVRRCSVLQITSTCAVAAYVLSTTDYYEVRRSAIRVQDWRLLTSAL
eukprot:2083548-Rhodomonas_salina.2